MSTVDLHPGLKFTSAHFSAKAEIVRMSEADNTIDVILTPSDGHAWEEKGWNLQHTKWAFESGDYKVLLENQVNISVI